MSEEVMQAQIDDLDFPECVRQRRGMYIYSKEHAISEIIDNAIDEANAGYATAVAVAIVGKTITVEDNGRGIPVTLYPKQDKYPGLTQAEVAYSVLHAGGKLNNKGYNGKSGGLNGVGGSCVNALSEWLELSINTGGKRYQVDFSKGLIKEHLREVEDGIEGTGTTVTFEFDESVWNGMTLDIKKVQKRVKQLAFLNPGVTMVFYVESEDAEGNSINIDETYYYEEGLKAYVEDLTKNKKLLTEAISAEQNSDELDVSIGLCYTDAYTDDIYTFCNNIVTPQGGDHLSGFKMGLAKAVNDYAIGNNLIKDKFDSDDIREGIIGVISIKVKNPQFEGQGKVKIDMREVRTPVRDITAKLVYDYLDKNPETAKIIVTKIQQAQAARLAAVKARNLARQQKQLLEGSLPGKLAKCTSKVPEECEIYIVEGDSAGGSAKQARDRRFQSVLPTKGKILNVEKQRIDRVLGSETIREAAIAFGCGLLEEFVLEECRYHKIIIMSDADKHKCPLCG